MTEQAHKAPPSPSVAAATSEQIIQDHVRMKEIEIRLKSKLLAASLVGVPLFALALSQHFTLFGPHSHWLAGAVGLAAGWAMGERAVFALIGGVVTYLLMHARVVE